MTQVVIAGTVFVALGLVAFLLISAGTSISSISTSIGNTLTNDGTVIIVVLVIFGIFAIARSR